jgi:MFS family permease
MPILFLVIFVVMAGFALLLPSILYVIVNMGATQAGATAMLASYSFAQFLIGPFLGRLSDRMGRRPMLIFTLAGSTLSYLFLASWAVTPPLVLVALVLAGLFAGNTAVVLAAVTDITDSENRAKGMGMVGAGIGLAFTVGPPVGALLGGNAADSATIAQPALVAAALCGLGLVTVMARMKETLDAGEDAASSRVSRLQAFGLIVRRPVLMQICLMMLFFTIPLSLMETTVGFYAETRFLWGPPELGAMFFVIGTTLMVVQGGLIGPLTKRFGEKALARAGVVMMGVGLFAIVLVPLDLFIYPAVALASVGVALFNTSMSTLASHRTTAAERGMVMGVFQSMQSLGRSSAPLIAGFLNQQMNGLPMIVGGGMVVAVFLWMMALYGRIDRAPEPAR